MRLDILHVLMLLKYTQFLSQGERGIYDLNARKLPGSQKGINIIRYTDGLTRKVIVR